jgi:hypothetical protein
VPEVLSLVAGLSCRSPLHTGEAARFYERCGYTVARPKASLERDAVLWRALG